MNPAKPAEAASQAAGDVRLSPRDGAAAAGTSGGGFGISGAERQALILWGVLCATLSVLVTAMNVITRYHHAPQIGLGRPLVDEGSSLLTTMLSFAVCAVLALWLRRKRPPLGLTVSVGVLGVLLYFTLHVGGFVLLRTLAYAAFFRETYLFGDLSRELPYEAAKDIAVYVIVTVILGQIMRLEERRAPVGPPRAAMVDIRDGGRLTRVAAGEILAVRSAGNYAEFMLEDGRRPLRRVPLATLEAEMAGLGFIRTHRSWLVNAGRVTGLRPQGSGDYDVELGAIEAPVSRRYKQALRRLREHGVPPG